MGLFYLTVPQRPPGRRVEDRDCDQGGVAFSPPRCSHHTGRQEGSTAERTRSKEERLSGTRSAGCHVPEPHLSSSFGHVPSFCLPVPRAHTFTHVTALDRA